jgi:hypothetical protein
MKYIKLIIIVVNILFLSDNNSYCQTRIKISSENKKLADGVYIFYNNKKCINCFTTLKKNLDTIRKGNIKIKYTTVFLIDSNSYSKSRYEKFIKKQFPYSDSSIIEFSLIPMDNLFSDQIPPNNGLFKEFNILTTPSILIKSRKTIYLFSTKDLFDEDMNLSSNFIKMLEKY